MKYVCYPLILSMLTLNLACSAGFSFLGEDDQADQNNPIILLPSDDNASPDNDIIRREFRLNSLAAPIDYLIILDNSISMDPIIGRIRDGLLNAADQDTFPSDSLIAVMTTMHGDPTNFSTTGLGVNRYEGIDFEPGFLNFVEESAVRNYRQAAPQFADRWTLDACANPWFQPKQRNSQATPCLVAALQTSASRVGAEAGALAFKHLLQKHSGQRLFRDQAMVNVIFVSDTHDPGRPDPILLELTPKFAELNQLIRIDNPINRLKFHALAPDQPCTSEQVYDRAYYQLADASGGIKHDPCNSEDYSNFVASMINSSRELIPAFRMEPPAAAILGIRLDGRLFSSYQLAEDGSLIYLDISLEEKPELVEVIYRPI